MTQSCSRTHKMHKARREQARRDRNPWMVKEAFEHYWLVSFERKDRTCKIIRFTVSLSLPKSIGAELDDRGCAGTGEAISLPWLFLLWTRELQGIKLS